MSKKKQKLYQPEFKAKIALDALKEEKTMAQLSSEHDMHVNNVLNWKKELVDNASLIFNRSNTEKAAKQELKEKDAQIEELYKEIGRLTTEVNWMKKKSRELGLPDKMPDR
jgi:transposase